MNLLLKKIIPLAFIAAFAATGCNEKTTKTEEVEITTMDSTSQALKENREKLEDQTEKVETSLEKLDNEFDSTQ